MKRLHLLTQGLLVAWMLGIGGLLLGPSTASAQSNFEFETNLDPLVTIPKAWEITPDTLDSLFPPYEGTQDKIRPFTWLTKHRDRAQFMRRPFSNVLIDFTIFGGEVEVEEVTVDFVEGKLNGITFSVYNRGDGDGIDAGEFDRRFKLCGQQIGEALEVRPFPRKANPTQGMLTEGWTWISALGMAVLEHNPEATNGNVEFLRMRMMPRDATGAMAAAMQSRSGAAVKLSDLPDNVKQDNASGDVRITGIPMVDQGPKGYCVVASAQRLFEYYGIPCDQHQLAQVADSDAERGTNSYAMSQALGKIDHRFKTRFKVVGMLYTDGKMYEDQRDAQSGRAVEQDDFMDEIVDYVDEGIPLLWSLELGRFPEEPAISPQAGGGHMRMIIGYNEREKKVLFTDSWGAGHELKRMKLADAFQATTGLFVMYPTTR